MNAGLAGHDDVFIESGVKGRVRARRQRLKANQVAYDAVSLKRYPDTELRMASKNRSVIAGGQGGIRARRQRLKAHQVALRCGIAEAIPRYGAPDS